MPQNLNFSVNGVQRKRTNGQVAFQWAPTDAITTTLDYTYSENKIQQQRNELSVWFNFGPSVTSWTDGPVAAPIIYSETINPATSDLSMGGMQLANVNENKSLGFNVAWEVSDGLRPGARLPRLLRRNASRQPVGFGGRARRRRIRARHDDRRFQRRLPGPHRRVAAGCARGRALAGAGHRLGVPERYTRVGHQAIAS